MARFDQLKYATLAAQLAQSEEGARYIPGALDSLAGPEGLDLGEDALGFIRGSQASEQGIKTAIETYHNLYNKKKSDQVVNTELLNYYQNAEVFNNLEDADRDKLVREFTRHQGLTFGQIEEQIKDAQYKLSDPENYFTDDQKDGARQILEGYQKFIAVEEMSERYLMESLRPDSVNATRVREMKNLADRL